MTKAQKIIAIEATIGLLWVLLTYLWYETLGLAIGWICFASSLVYLILKKECDKLLGEISDTHLIFGIAITLLSVPTYMAIKLILPSSIYASKK